MYPYLNYSINYIVIETGCLHSSVSVFDATDVSKVAKFGHEWYYVLNAIPT